MGAVASASYPIWIIRASTSWPPGRLFRRYGGSGSAERKDRVWFWLWPERRYGQPCVNVLRKQLVEARVEFVGTSRAFRRPGDSFRVIPQLIAQRPGVTSRDSPNYHADLVLAGQSKGQVCRADHAAIGFPSAGELHLWMKSGAVFWVEEPSACSEPGDAAEGSVGAVLGAIKAAGR